MRKHFLTTVAGLLGLTVLSLMTACGGSRVDYKVLKHGDGKTHPEIGDYIIGEMWILAGDSLLGTNAGHPEPLIQVAEHEFEGDVQDGIRLLYEGDSARINVPADSLRVRGMQLPPFVDKTITYVFKVNKIVPGAEFPAYLEALAAEADIDQQQAIAAYLHEHNLTVKPTDDGLYLIRHRDGKGRAIQQGAPVKFHYVGRLLDGTVFDTSLEDVAEENGMLNPMRTYKPLEVMAGTGQMIQGMDEALLMMREGDKATVIIPFQLAYGAQGMGPIRPYSPLIFEMEIVSVENPSYAR